jgi:hypothetical protein
MTISKILDSLSNKITTLIQLEYGVTMTIDLSNIATLNDGDDFVDKSSVILSIVNIEEDKTLKNQFPYKEYSGTGNTVDKYKRPSQNLNISILFTSYNKDQGKMLYTQGIDKLEYIVRCLQHNNVYYYDNTNFFEQTEVSESQAKNLNKLILDMVSLKSDQLNQMWSYLGNKYMPSVLYCMRLITIQNENIQTARVIEKAKIQLWENDITAPVGLIEESGEFTK